MSTPSYYISTGQLTVCLLPCNQSHYAKAVNRIAISLGMCLYLDFEGYLDLRSLSIKGDRPLKLWVLAGEGWVVRVWLFDDLGVA